MTDPDGLDLNPNLARTRLRKINILNFDGTNIAQDRSTHQASPLKLANCSSLMLCTPPSQA